MEKIINDDNDYQYEEADDVDYNVNKYKVKMTMKK